MNNKKIKQKLDIRLNFDSKECKEIKNSKFI